MTQSYPFIHHPCYSSQRDALWERIHLPIAKSCNVKCLYCDHSGSTQCHTARPGFGARLMTSDQALECVVTEMKRRPSLKIVAVSGPGDPLYNDETFDVLHRVRASFEDVEFCMSTNGVLLSEYVSELVELGMKTLTVTVNAVTPLTASRVYEWALIDNCRIRGHQMGVEITKRQQRGIREATHQGLFVKVNTVMMPGYNDCELVDIAKIASQIGVSLQNIVPLYPFDKLSEVQRPTHLEITEARTKCSKHIPQFYHCEQCRCDVVGIPGSDTVL